MAAVDERTGTIATAGTRPYGQIKRGYTLVREGDVLFAKITPCMQNGKHAVARGLAGNVGFASTEFHVVRPGTNVLADWIHRYLRQPSVLSEAALSFTGSAGQQRVPADFLRCLEIPVPPLAEQHRIIALLDAQMAAVERARAAAAMQLSAAQALPAAYLRAIFTSREAQRWPRRALGDASEIVSGITLGRQPRGALARSIPYLRVANVKDGYLELFDVYEIEATEAEIGRLRLRSGDLLLTEGGDLDKLGRGTVWRDELPECLHQNHIFRVRFDMNQFVPDFVSAQVGSQYGKAYFLAHGKRTTGIATINQRVLAAFPLMAPDRAEQERIVNTLHAEQVRLERMKHALGVRLTEIDAMSGVLLRRAFSGDL